jgi:hypothetical protein
MTPAATCPPRGPAGQAARRYLLAGLLACGRCGRRLESAWSNGKPAYRCRHGYTSATSPDHGRPKNTYVREDQILPHLAAMAILLAGDSQARGLGAIQVTIPELAKSRSTSTSEPLRPSRTPDRRST